jgi:hypothetical protein
MLPDEYMEEEQVAYWLGYYDAREQMSLVYINEYTDGYVDGIAYAREQMSPCRDEGEDKHVT